MVKVYRWNDAQIHLGIDAEVALEFFELTEIERIDQGVVNSNWASSYQSLANVSQLPTSAGHALLAGVDFLPEADINQIQLPYA